MAKFDYNKRSPLERCVVAALESGAKLRRPEAPTADNGAANDPVDRVIATIEAEASRIQAHDLSAVDTVFASQALALDTIFTQLAMRAVEHNLTSEQILRLALKAQSQSHMTLRTLFSIAAPRPKARQERQTRNSGEQTIETGNCST